MPITDQNDNFASNALSSLGPARSAFAITPTDGAVLPQFTRGIYIGTGGDISLQLMSDANPVTLTNVGSGVILPLRVTIINATGTTASDIIGLR